MRNWKAVAGLLVGMAMSGASYAQDKSASTLTMEDYVEIQHLYSRYHWAADARNGKAWADLFTPDGEFISGSSTTKGR